MAKKLGPNRSDRASDGLAFTVSAHHQIEPPSDPFAKAVIEALAKAGHEARYAGGLVRDSLLGRPVGDIDIATTAEPDSVCAALETAGIRPIPTGLDHGTITAVGDGRAIEVTSLRRDIETDGRHAVVAFGTDWREDAQRRDFTMNALFADGTGLVFDFVGGVEDALARRLRFVGDAELRVREDYLRILRFFRFHAQIGGQDPDDSLLAILRKHANSLANLSAERITQELLRLLAADDPAPSWHLAAHCGVDRAALGDGVRPADQLSRLIVCEKRAGCDAEPLRRLCLLGGDDRLVLSNGQRKRVDAVRSVMALMTGPSAPSNAAVRLALFQHGRDGARDGMLLAWVGSSDWTDGAALEALRLAEETGVPVFPLSGRDVLSLGLEPGEAVGALLADVQSWWIEGGLVADRRACYARLRLAVEAYSITRTV